MKASLAEQAHALIDFIEANDCTGDAVTWKNNEGKRQESNKAIFKRMSFALCRSLCDALKIAKEEFEISFIAAGPGSEPDTILKTPWFEMWLNPSYTWENLGVLYRSRWQMKAGGPWFSGPNQWLRWRVAMTETHKLLSGLREFMPKERRPRIIRDR